MNKRNIISSLAFVSLVAATIASGQGTQAAADVPQASPQLQYRVVDLGEDAIGNGIIDSGQIVGSRSFGGAPRHAAFWPHSQSPRLISAHYQVLLKAGGLVLIHAARW